MLAPITRREFAVLAASLLIGSKNQPFDTPTQEVLPSAAREDLSWTESFERWLDEEAERAIAAGGRVRRQLATAGDVRRHAAHVRRGILKTMGGLPVERTPLNARTTNSFAREGYRVDGLVFESLPGFFVAANLYVPTTHSGPFPVVLGTAGHSDIGKAAPTYQPVWVNLARRGVMVLAYDPPGQGERIEDYDANSKTSRFSVGTQAHNHTGQQCLLTGTSIARYFAWDGVRAIDYLLTRPDVDPVRIGVAGNSGGGTQAAWLAAVDGRIAVVDSSCYITSWSALWNGPGPQDMEQVLPGFLSRGLDFVDVIAAVAPRPYLVSSAIRDFFPIDGARTTVAEARRLYGTFGADGALKHAEHNDTHGWSQPLRKAAYQWFAQWWLDVRNGVYSDEYAVTGESAEQLRATPTGQVATSFKSRTVFDINADRARTLAHIRPRVTAARVRSLLQVPRTMPSAQVANRRPAMDVGGLRTERLDLVLNNTKLKLPGLLIHPRSSHPRGSVLVAGGRDGAAPDDRVNTERAARLWTERGYLTLVLHVRGAGALASTRAAADYSFEYQLAARAWLLGTSIVAWQTCDLIAGLRFLEDELSSAIAERVLHAEGLTAPAGVFAAALHRVSAAWIENGLLSYLDLATSRNYSADARLFVPGVLEVTDLLDVMALATPAMIHLVRPRRANGRSVQSESQLRDGLALALPDNVRLTTGSLD